MLTGLLVGIFGMLTLIVIKLAISNASLKNKVQHQIDYLAICMTEIEQLKAKLDPKALDEEQKEFKKLVEAKWKTAFEYAQNDLIKKIADQKLKFEEDLKTKYDEACKTINFSVVDYKKTINKKRKAATRKADNKSQKKFRSIDDE